MKNILCAFNIIQKYLYIFFYQDEEKITCSYFSYLFLHLPYLTLMHIYIRIEYSHNLCTCIILKKIRYVYKIYVK
ncbi:hypothetical protein PFMC_01520 [Plasmodium falciparum CAMP/Malaysia]|uniref:Uncharacterized protein n=2 Tax=Plasmodium falciparum TaxID=5833 RepID=W7JN39_PLAFO|nr:hypothetical protein PFMC_01520 [Plasmodium falciparum CAMP/Malaysia]EWC86061.1 hypothetical protein PFNF54_05165 [Plasmodium falciparum NF54]